MLKPETITALIDEAVKAIKKHNAAGNEKEFPEYNPIYSESVTLDDEVAVHAEVKLFPQKLFKAKAPNETQLEYDYRKSSYQPETLSLWNRALGNTNRIFNEQNYTVNFKEEGETDKQSEYFLKEYPSYGSLIAYFDSVVRPRKINYPNSILCIKPRDIPFEIVEVEAGSKKEYQYQVRDNELLEPVAVIYPARQVIQFKDSQYALILLNEKSWVKDGGSDKPKKEGLVFELYDKEAIYRIEQVGKKSEWRFETYMYYQHDWDKLPAIKLKGQPIDKDGDIVYKSYFYDAVPSLNQALYDSSTLQVSKVANVFLEKWEYAEHCEAQWCVSGKITKYDDNDNATTSTCGTCNGTGWKRNGVLGVYSLRLPERLNPGAEPSTPPVGYIQKNTEVLEFLRNEIKYNERKSFLFMGIDVSDSEVKGTETALGKMIDREALFSALKVIANELFDAYEFTINAIGYMRHGPGFKAPHINRPTTFAIRSYETITKEIIDAKAAGLPEVALREINREFMKTRFSDNALKTEISEVVDVADDLQMMLPVDVATAVMAQFVAKWQAVLHVNIYRFIEEELVTDPKWLKKDMKEKVEALQERAKALEKEIAPKQNTADDILNNMGGGA